MAIVLAILVGTLIGVLLGLIGGGGSILTVPILVYLLGQDVHGATATTLVIVTIKSPAGAAAQMGSGTVDFSLAALFIRGFAGASVGGRLAGRADETQLSRTFAAFVALVGLSLIIRNVTILA